MNFSVVVPSANAANLVACVRSLQAAEPELSPQEIIVVDDGARAIGETSLPDVRWITGITPFIFARNANLGIMAAGRDVVLMNDDANLLTPNGFSMLWAEVLRHPEIGVCSAGIQGMVGNPRQIATSAANLRYEPRAIAFVCVLLPWSTYVRIGPLDERFVGYGFEDNDYCTRVAAAGFKIGIWDGCVVEHAHRPSAFRSRPDIMTLFDQNRQLYRSKWGRDA
ncbi:MAG TPA: glycosyltransferase [Candidatus Angelobacter sp.]|jgi:GT2 family glycosyltransferase|nr:glycosyltransferase [Candidatus Angelobacter sp.]